MPHNDQLAFKLLLDLLDQLELNVMPCVFFKNRHCKAAEFFKINWRRESLKSSLKSKDVFLEAVYCEQSLLIWFLIWNKWYNRESDQYFWSTKREGWIWQFYIFLLRFNSLSPLFKLLQLNLLRKSNPKNLFYLGGSWTTSSSFDSSRKLSCSFSRP